MDWKRNFTTVARISSTNGNAGQVVLSFLSFFPEDLNYEEPVYIEFDGLPVPFFIDDAQPRGNSKLIAHLTDVNCLKDAEELLGKEVMIALESETEEEPDLIGWSVFDQNGNKVGTVTDFIDIPGNPCLELDSKTVIPAAEDLILDINEDGQAIHLTIPEGLLD